MSVVILMTDFKEIIDLNILICLAGYSEKKLAICYEIPWVMVKIPPRYIDKY